MTAKEYLLDIYNNNAWMNERILKIGLQQIEENGYTVEQLQQVLSDLSASMKANFKKVFSRMGNKAKYYKLKQNIFKTQTEEMVVIKGRFQNMRLAGSYKVMVAPYFNYNYKVGEVYVDPSFIVEAEDEELRFNYVFDTEQLYRITVNYLLDGEEVLLLQTNVYAVEEDLFNRMYLKADLHMHTTSSDGFEAPDLVVASAREKGMDVIAVTDHNAYEGSVLAQQAAKAYGLSMTVLRGEEYSLEYTKMHILNLGSQEPIDRRFLSKELLWDERTKEIMVQAKDVVSDVKSYSCIQRLLEEIKAIGGVSILCHPLWKVIHAYGRMDVPMQTFLDLAKDKKFDGMEIVSGSQLKEYHVSSMQDLLAREMLKAYENLPVIGITDSHYYTADPITGRHYTILFSTGNSEEEVLQAIKEGWTVAVEEVEQTAQCYGSMRLALFAQFLCEAYFPEKAEAARVEGYTMRKKLETEFTNR